MKESRAGNKKGNDIFLVRFILGFDHIMSRIEDTVASIMFTLMTIIVLLNVLFRYVLHIPMMWGEELSRYLMILGVYVGVIICVREKAHLGISGLVDRLAPRPKRFVNMLVDLATICGYMTIVVLEYNFMFFIKMTRQTSPAIHIPMHLLYGVLVVCFCLCVFRALIVFADTYVYDGSFLTREKEEIS